MTVQLRWEGDDKDQYLFAGCLEVELAWLNKRKVQWSGVIWLPGLSVKEFNTLPAHKKNIEDIVSHWFGLANTSLPAMEQSEDEGGWNG